jgi:hypothetical protein
MNIFCVVVTCLAPHHVSPKVPTLIELQYINFYDSDSTLKPNRLSRHKLGTGILTLLYNQLIGVFKFVFKTHPSYCL